MKWLALLVFLLPAMAGAQTVANVPGDVGSNLQYAFISYNDATVTSSAAIGHVCPWYSTATPITNAEADTDLANNMCQIPLGFGVRFYWIGLVATSALADNTEECRFAVTYAATRAGNYNVLVPDNIVDLLSDGTTDAYIHALPASNDTSKSLGYSPTTVLLDFNEVVIGWWSVMLAENASGTCSSMKSVNLTIAYKLFEL